MEAGVAAGGVAIVEIAATVVTAATAGKDSILFVSGFSAPKPLRRFLFLTLLELCPHSAFGVPAALCLHFVTVLQLFRH
jgi:hypothetical protein